MNLGEKGRVHSNIPDSQTYTVIDIGFGAGDRKRFLACLMIYFILGQRAWRIVSQEGKIIRASRFGGQATAPAFQQHKDAGAFFNMLPANLKGNR